MRSPTTLVLSIFHQQKHKEWWCDDAHFSLSLAFFYHNKNSFINTHQDTIISKNIIRTHKITFTLIVTQCVMDSKYILLLFSLSLIFPPSFSLTLLLIYILERESVKESTSVKRVFFNITKNSLSQSAFCKSIYKTRWTFFCERYRA